MKKSHATMLAACARRNLRQLGCGVKKLDSGGSCGVVVSVPAPTPAGPQILEASEAIRRA
jgi:hypothetical protein